MSENRKTVLIVTYYFPPSGGAGVQRTLKFVKYLRDFGWEPIVLTAENADYPIYDESFLSEIPQDVKVYRSRIIEPYRFYRRFTGKQSNESVDIATLSLDEKSKRKFSERLSEFIRATFFIPDARIGWLYFAFQTGKRILKENKIDAILSSAPPYTTHLIGRRLKQYSGLPWVADFRDSWIGWVNAPRWRPAISRKIEMHMEKAVLREADKIITVSNGVKEHLLSRHKHLNDGRWRFLPNGYDAADFKDIIPSKRNGDKFVITYVGSMYGPRNPEYLVQALEKFYESEPNFVKNIKMQIIGRVGEPIINRIEASCVHDLFEFVPYVAHHESLAYLVNSDACLLIIDDIPQNRGVLTGKIFEYIGAGRPILALAPDGDAADLIREYNLGEVAHPKNVDEIQVALKSLCKTNDGNELNLTADQKQKFERKAQTGELSNILDEVFSEKK